jgi:hypothetical protein
MGSPLRESGLDGHPTLYLSDGRPQILITKEKVEIALLAGKVLD